MFLFRLWELLPPPRTPPQKCQHPAVLPSLPVGSATEAWKPVVVICRIRTACGSSDSVLVSSTVPVSVITNPTGTWDKTPGKKSHVKRDCVAAETLSSQSRSTIIQGPMSSLNVVTPLILKRHQSSNRLTMDQCHQDSSGNSFMKLKLCQPLASVTMVASATSRRPTGPGRLRAGAKIPKRATCGILAIECFSVRIEQHRGVYPSFLHIL